MTIDSASRPASPSQLSWLNGEVTAWRAAGVVSDDQAAAILSRYRATRGFSLAALVLTLGAVFVGIGLIWLVAANLDELAPLWRFVAVACFWVAFTVGAELLSSSRGHGGSIPSPVVGAVRMMAALVFGAVIFQAAQSLQVPAYEPKLMGYWALGALVYAYAVRAMGPLVVALATGTVWYVWQVSWDATSGLGVVLGFLTAGVAAVSLAALQERWHPSFSEAWREVGATLLLIGLFTAAVPGIDDAHFTWTTSLVVGLVATGLTAVAAAVFGWGRARLEPLAGLALAAVAVLLVLWEAGNDSDQVELGDWAHAAVAVTAYVFAAAGVAALGVLRDSWRLTAVATVALVIFTTFQAFAVFAQIIQGAWLFVVLGLIFLATGYLFDRGRRQLARTLEDEAVALPTEGAES